MSRLFVLLILVLALGGAAYYLSTLPQQQPTRVIEVDVAAADANAG